MQWIFASYKNFNVLKIFVKCVCLQFCKVWASFAKFFSFSDNYKSKLCASRNDAYVKLIFISSIGKYCLDKQKYTRNCATLRTKFFNPILNPIESGKMEGVGDYVIGKLFLVAGKIDKYIIFFILKTYFSSVLTSNESAWKAYFVAIFLKHYFHSINIE